MGVYTISKTFRFEASHQLPHHDGKCRRLHGHSWVGRVFLTSGKLEITGPKRGMVMDYGDIKKVLEPLIDTRLDHWHLNDSTGLENPTSENLAKWIYDYLKPDLPLLDFVEIEETCTSSARYFGME